VERGGWEAAAQVVALAAAGGAGRDGSDGGGVRGNAPVHAVYAADDPANAWHAGASTELHPASYSHSTTTATHHDADTGDVYTDSANADADFLSGTKPGRYRSSNKNVILGNI